MNEEESGNNDFSNLTLKKDYEKRPIWVAGNGLIFLETFSPFFEQAYDFLVAISEPISRPEHIHEYKITPYSLYAAASVGLTYFDIVNTLDRLSKNEISNSLRQRIRKETEKCGKVKILLRDNRFFVESFYISCLQDLLQREDIKSSKIDVSITLKTLPNLQMQTRDILVNNFFIQNKFGEEKTETRPLYLFEIKAENSERVKKCCRDIGYPTLEEYDFKKDSSMPFDISLKAGIDVRSYQKKSLSRMLGNGRARSGIIVLPCGAGKTLVGILAACTISKSTIVFATTGVSCEQWKSQFLKWTNLSFGGREKDIKMFIASRKDLIEPEKPCILITTYSMIAFTQRRSKEAELMMKEIRNREWSLVILDEVHVAPAEMFRKCLSITKSKCKLGLTATLVREDEKIEDLFFLIGPKLYEADWLNLQRQRYLAEVKCIEIWCPMSPYFLREYLKQNSLNRKTLLQTMNPNKFQNCEYLIKYHESKGDKIMVFSDNIYSLKKYAIALQKPYIYGKTSDHERMLTLDALQHDSRMNTIFISKIGDCSIDLPDVNVIIQISSHFSSRRQEAQRLGRILRPKAKSNACAYFYTLVSQDTDECIYASKRQRFLVDQGYSFQVKQNLIKNSKIEQELMFSSKEDQLRLLDEIMKTSEAFGAIESDVEEEKKEIKTKRKKVVKKKLKDSRLRNIRAKLIKLGKLKQNNVAEE